MSRKMYAFALVVLTLALALIPGVHAEDPIRNLKVVQGLPDKIVAGSRYEVIFTFDSIAYEPVPFALNVTATCTGAPIDLGEVMLEGVRLNDVPLIYVEAKPGFFKSAGKWTLAPRSSNVLRVSLSSVVNLMPGTYAFEFTYGVASVIIPSPPEPTPSEPLTPAKIIALPPADAADILEGLPPGEAAGLLEQITPEEAGAILAEVNPEDAGQIIDVMPTEDAVPIIEALDPAAAANILENADSNVAADILDQVPAGDAYAILGDMDVLAAAPVVDDMAVERVVDVVAAAVEAGNVDGIANIFNNASEQTVTNVLLTSPVNDGAAVIESMASQDLNAAALRVEAMVKERLKYVDPEVAASIMEHATQALEKVSVASLVDLFREIAGLPATPSTVAAVFEKMDLSVTMNVVDEWIKTGDVASLGEVFGYLTTPTLQKIYLTMTPAQRAALYPALAPETVARLPAMPRPAEFVLSGLIITGPHGEIGEAWIEKSVAVITISVKVTNVGDLEGNTTVDLLVKGVKEQSKPVTLAGGASTTVSFSVTKTTVGSYAVKVGDLTGSFTVKEAPPPPPPKPAAFEISDLVVSRGEVIEGESVTVTVKVTNVGEEEGTHTVDLKVDGLVFDSKTVTLAGGASATVIFSVTKTTSGSYMVKIGDLTGSFTVKAPGIPTAYIAGILIFIAAVAASVYALYRRGRLPLHNLPKSVT